MNRDEERILKALQDASSQIPEKMKPAEDILEEYQYESGFYSTLVKIFSEFSIALNVRWLAVLYFKNCVDRFWRKNSPNAVSEPEKAQIRVGLLQNVREPVNQIAIQLALLIAKLSRVDCPKEWPELLPTLFEGVKNGDNLIRSRSLLTLHHVVKQLSSKRLANDRKVFQELTSHMFVYIFELWQSETNLFLSPEANNASDIMPYLERSHLSLKILKTLLIFGFKKPHENQEAVNFLQNVYSRTSFLFDFRKKHEHEEQVKIVIEKYLVLVTKIYFGLIEDHPYSFMQFIRPWLELIINYLFTPAGEGLLFKRIVIQLFNLMKGILVCPEYRPSKIIDEKEKNPRTIEASRIKSELFSQPVLVELCTKLLSHYLPLKQDDLEFWESDPEGFALELEEGESWKYSLRPCIESLFVSLFHEYRDILTPTIVNMVRNCTTLVDPNDLNAILHKDAVYNAIGLSSFDLFDEIDFDQLFTDTLVKELRIMESNYRIIRRRAIWLVGKWVGVKFNTKNRPMLYEICLHLLSPNEDFVVRLTAALTLKYSIDEFEFESDQFVAYLQNSFELLFTLLKSANECDTKMQVLHVMSLMIELVGSHIQSHAEPLVQYLPALWQQSTDHNMLRCSILTTYIYIVHGLLHESEKLHPFLIPIICTATDTNEDSHIYLLEDALQLWLAVLENARTPSPALIDVFSNIIPLLEYSSDNLRLCLHITNAYLLFAPQLILERYGTTLVQTFQYLMTDLKSEGLVLILKSIETMLRVLPGQASPILQCIYPKLMENIVQSSLYPMVLSMYLSLMARIVLCDENIFTAAISKTASNLEITEERVLLRILTVWSSKMSLVSPDERKKLCALGLTQLCSKHWPPVLEVWATAVTSIAEVIFDITVEESNDDKLVLSMCESLSEDYDRDTEHFERLQNLFTRDPVHTTPLRTFLGTQLKIFGAGAPPNLVKELFETLEEDCKNLLTEITSE